MTLSRQKAETADAALLSAVARGDHAAYAALYRRYAPLLLGLLYRILGDRAEAEDVLQEVLVQVWRRAGEFDGARGTPYVWLTMLARSRAFDRLDRVTSRRRTIGRAIAVVPANVPDPVEQASAAEDGRRLLRALAAIPDSQRDVLILAYFDGLSQSEIASRLQRPIGTVKSNARLGLAKLRQLLRVKRENRWNDR